MTKTPDVLVIGGGVFGLACAFELLSSGLGVTVIDKEAPGRGASGGILGALSPHMPENWDHKKQFQLTALLASPEFWGRVEMISGLPTGYGRIGRMMPILSEKALDLAQMRVAAAKEQWPDPMSWRIDRDSDQTWLAHAPFGAVYETMSARIFPRQACCALVAAIAKLGGSFYESKVTHISEGEVRLADGLFLHAKRVLVTAGHASFELLNFPAGFGTEIKGQAALLSPIKPLGPLIFADGLYVLPHYDGHIAIGSSNEKSYRDPFATDNQLDVLIAKARKTCPALANCHVVERWAGIRPRASRPDPIIGEAPGMSGVLIASGGFKIGFGLAPAVASAIRDLIIGRDACLPANFTPSAHLEHARLAK